MTTKHEAREKAFAENWVKFESTGAQTGWNAGFTDGFNLGYDAALAARPDTVGDAGKLAIAVEALNRISGWIGNDADWVVKVAHDALEQVDAASQDGFDAIVAASQPSSPPSGWVAIASADDFPEYPGRYEITTTYTKRDVLRAGQPYVDIWSFDPHDYESREAWADVLAYRNTSAPYQVEDSTQPRDDKREDDTAKKAK